jgi:hypothetical protein
MSERRVVYGRQEIEEARDIMNRTWPTFTAGQRVRFSTEKQAYTVRAVSKDGRYVICTKPFNARRTVLYTVLDLELGVRGRDNYYGLGYETDEAVAHALEMFEDSDAEVSSRSWLWIGYDDRQPDPSVASMLPDLRAQAESAVHSRQNQIWSYRG